MIELVIDQRRKDLGGFEVGRVLPYAKRRTVGPFIFFHRTGPVEFAPGFPRTVDVRPHPHIGLSTVLGRPADMSTGPMWSKKAKGPTMRRLAKGRTRPTSKPPRSLRRWSMTSSIILIFLE